MGPLLPNLPEPVYENLPLALSPVLLDLEKGAQTTLAAVPESTAILCGEKRVDASLFRR